MAGVIAITAVVFLIVFVACCIWNIIYNLYFHPLRQFPGPRLWGATVLTRHVYSIQGKYDIKLRAFHDEYGDVVRYQPDALSFTTAQAWNDIYGFGHSQVPKDHKFYVLPSSTGDGTEIFTAIDNSTHTRMRRALSHAFSERALHEQEPVLQRYIGSLIEKLERFALDGIPVDLCKLYNYAAFDLIGDLTFGQSFDCLKNEDYHPFVGFIFEIFRSRPWLSLAKEYPFILPILSFLIPSEVRKARAAVTEYARETALKRLSQGTTRKDFMSSILRGTDEKTKLSEAEIVANSRTLIIAGSESSASVLAGATYWLIKTPKAYNKACEEVRACFSSDEDITIASVKKIPYTMACLEEGMRMFPSGPTALPRRLREPKCISGYNIPSNTSVAVHHSAAYSSKRNFYKPDCYMPERWMPESTRPGSPFATDVKEALQPFSVGPRNCIRRNLGYAEVRLIMAKMLWNFDMELGDDSKDWHVGMKAYVMWDKPPLTVRLTKRKS